MRQVKSISLSKELVEYIEREVKTGGYMSTSEFLRKLIREHKDREVLDNIRKSEEEYKAGEYYDDDITPLESFIGK